MDEQTARDVLERVATAWRTGRPDDAAACFTDDARYLEPPDRQRYIGWKDILAFFGGGEATPPRMGMEWHGIGYDARSSTAYGEYTFRATVPMVGSTTVWWLRPSAPTGSPPGGSTSTAAPCRGMLSSAVRRPRSSQVPRIGRDAGVTAGDGMLGSCQPVDAMTRSLPSRS